MKILFMGTPDYAAVTLKELSLSNHEICGVFAQPDKPVGRKHILTPPPVKVLAEELGLKVFQPDTLKDGSALKIIEELAPDIIVVVAYGKILPREILNYPKYGCINGHASILPKYRGASPIQWAIVCGETETGVTAMYMDEGMDTGDIIKTVVTPIGEIETAEELFDRLSVLNAKLMAQTVSDIESGNVKRKKQDDEKATYAPIIKKEMAEVDFNKPANEVFNAIRGYYSWPCAYFFLNGKRIKVVKAKICENTNLENGKVVSGKDRFIIACADNTAIEILELIPEGGKRMTASAFLSGNPLKVGESLV